MTMKMLKAKNEVKYAAGIQGFDDLVAQTEDFHPAFGRPPLKQTQDSGYAVLVPAVQGNIRFAGLKEGYEKPLLEKLIWVEAP